MARHRDPTQAAQVEKCLSSGRSNIPWKCKNGVLNPFPGIIDSTGNPSICLPGPHGGILLGESMAFFPVSPASCAHSKPLQSSPQLAAFPGPHGCMTQMLPLDLSAPYLLLSGPTLSPNGDLFQPFIKDHMSLANLEIQDILLSSAYLLVQSAGLWWQGEQDFQSISVCNTVP